MRREQLMKDLFGPNSHSRLPYTPVNVKESAHRIEQLRDAILPIFPWFPYFQWHIERNSGRIAFQVGNYNTYYGQTLLDAVNAACDDYWVDRA
jgi:hypothetical protein